MSEEWPEFWYVQTATVPTPQPPPKVVVAPPTIRILTDPDRQYRAIPIWDLQEATSGYEGWQLDSSIAPFEGNKFKENYGQWTSNVECRCTYVMIWRPTNIARALEQAAEVKKEADQREQRSHDRVAKLSDIIAERWDRLEAAHKLGGIEAVKALITDLGPQADIDRAKPTPKRRY